MSPAMSLTGVLALLCVCAGIRAHHSSGDGPTTWGDKCEACNGQQQSPINIDTSQVQVRELPDVTGGWSQAYNYTLSNDGNTVTLVVQTSDSIIVQGGPLEDPYDLSALQFRWGSNNSVGSEHTINGERFPLELQYLLKRKSEDGGPDHELRIAQVFRLTNEPNVALSEISTLLSSVVQPGSQVASSRPLVYSSFFSGYPVNDYYYYNGSLTTPPCTEGIPWLVYPPGLLTNGVTHDVLSNFRNLMSENGPLVNNFRPVQELNGRLVVASSRSTQVQATGGCGQNNGATSMVRGGIHSNAERHGAARRHH